MILNVLNSIANTSSSNEKLAILKSNLKNEELQRVYRLTYSKQIQFGIKKIPDYTISKSDFENTLDNALDFLEFKLAKRVVTGNTAIANLTDVLSTLTESDAEVIKRIIKRDLECGASATMANKVWKDLIPKQPQMLASSMSEKALKEIVYPAYAQLKADGARCFAEIRGFERDDVKLLSRAGNEYLRLDDLKDDLISIYKQVAEEYPEGIMIDGELVYIAPKKKQTLEDMFDAIESPESFSQTEVSARTESNGFANKSLKNTISVEEAKRMSFQVWDFVSLDVIYGESVSPQYSTRFMDLKDLVKDHGKLILIEHHLVFDLNQAREVYNKYVMMGLEGIILKNRDSLWENKRSKNLVKFKEEVTIDLKIVGVKVHNKDPEKLGAVLLESECGKIKVSCGSGFTDTYKENAGKNGGMIDIPFERLDVLNRKRLWIEQDTLIGKIMEIKCNGWVKSDGRTDSLSLFLPVIEKLRIDKDVANTFEDVFGDTYPL